MYGTCKVEKGIRMAHVGYMYGTCKVQGGYYVSHAIITLIEKVSKALDSGKIVVGVF